MRILEERCRERAFRSASNASVEIKFGRFAPRCNEDRLSSNFDAQSVYRLRALPNPAIDPTWVLRQIENMAGKCWILSTVHTFL